ncbi:hypothetical protein Csa_022834 [Cucumis sativus]|uniref:Uncharacterized protein n=1 Tax=Cucumis sativus TaxID=3659 RepID=A0A0A0LV16_CUCSA|nr:hypothetical protein Csa_022834 [Cucumis sativus]
MRRLTLAAILMLVLITSVMLIEGTTLRSPRRLIDINKQREREINENEKAKTRRPNDSGEYNHHGCLRRDVDCWSNAKQSTD